MKVSEQALAKALRKRRAHQPKALVLDPNFPLQNKFIEDMSRYIVAQCSRRAGKTNGLAIRFFRTLEKHPGAQCIYLSLTRESAISIMWPVLIELNEKYGLGCTFIESKLIMIHPNGAKLRLLGADMKNFIKRLKGIKSPGIAIDEAQDFGSHLQTLIDDVLTPTMVDYSDSWLAVTGTPGPVPQGYFFQITQERKYGYSFHEWTILENPNIHNPYEFIEDLKNKREWEDNNPTLLREWRNKWVLDVQSLWVRYQDGINHYQELPEGKYTYILGIDIGYNDADALAVLAWSESSPTTYLVEEVINKKQGLTELVEQIQDVQRRYDIAKMVIDEGGLGKKLAEEMRRRHSIPVHGADKARKQENVEFLNDALRLGRFKAKSSSRFAQDSYLVQVDWDKSTPDRIIVKKKPHSDIIDAVLYSFKESPAYAMTMTKAGPKYGTKEWADAQEHLMWESAQEHFAKQAELERQFNGQDD